MCIHDDTGLCQAAAHNLRQIGVDDFLILERRPWIGGTWSQNSYPGAAVDVQSPLYSLSFEPYPWSQMFAEQHELVEYTKYCIQKHKVADKVRLNADVQQVQWDEARQLWVIDTATQGQFLAKYQTFKALNKEKTSSPPDEKKPKPELV